MKQPDTGQIDTFGNQAPDGIVGPYRQREGSFYTIKEIWSPIRVALETNGTLTVENHYSFTDANRCRFVWRLHNYWGSHWELLPFTIDIGVANAPSIPPGTKGTLRLNLPKYWNSSADALSLVVTDPSGRELWKWVWPLQPYEVLAPNAGIAGRADNFGGTNNGVIELKCKDPFRHEDLVVRVDGRTGELMEVERAGKKFSLNNGPRLATTNSTLKKVVWQLRDDGWLQCDYTYAAEGTNHYFGVTFDYPENLVQAKKWLGDGPYRVWKNRLRGETFGFEKNNYNNNITGYRDWIYPEFKGCFAGVRWLQLDTQEGAITVVPKDVPFVQVLTPEFPPTNLVGKAFATLPQCGLGFLNAIPPIGSKFKGASTCGPQSQPNIANGEYSGSVIFYFGKLP